MAPAKNMVKPVGEWNRYTLTLKDRLLQVDFNGLGFIIQILNNFLRRHFSITD